MKAFVIAFGAAALFASAAQAETAIALPMGEVKIDQPYGEAREILIGSGFQPAGICTEETHGPNCIAAYPELDSCADTGLAPCRFLWKSEEGWTLVVLTQGEVKIISGLEREGAR